jgi:hypothetical protein
MGCGCRKGVAQVQLDGTALQTLKESTGKYVRENRPKPLEQCLFCAQKHADEALIAMNEFTYDVENRNFIHGSLRSVVNHTFKSWPEIAFRARESALKWQEARFDDSRKLLDEIIRMIDEALLKENPDIAERINEAEDAREKKGQETEEPSK